MKFLIRLFFTSATLLAVAYIVPGIHMDGFLTAVVAALILGILNAIVRPILLLLTFPITILTLGIFIFVINASLFLLVAKFVDGFSIDGFFSAFLGSILVSIISSFINHQD
jgi:putative membrane protein